MYTPFIGSIYYSSHFTITSQFNSCKAFPCFSRVIIFIWEWHCARFQSFFLKSTWKSSAAAAVHFQERKNPYFRFRFLTVLWLMAFSRGLSSHCIARWTGYCILHWKHCSYWLASLKEAVVFAEGRPMIYCESLLMLRNGKIYNYSNLSQNQSKVLCFVKMLVY